MRLPETLGPPWVGVAGGCARAARAQVVGGTKAVFCIDVCVACVRVWHRGGVCARVWVVRMCTGPTHTQHTQHTRACVCVCGLCTHVGTSVPTHDVFTCALCTHTLVGTNTHTTTTRRRSEKELEKGDMPIMPEKLSKALGAPKSLLGVHVHKGHTVAQVSGCIG